MPLEYQSANHVSMSEVGNLLLLPCIVSLRVDPLTKPEWQKNRKKMASRSGKATGRAR